MSYARAFNHPTNGTFAIHSIELRGIILNSPGQTRVGYTRLRFIRTSVMITVQGELF